MAEKVQIKSTMFFNSKEIEVLKQVKQEPSGSKLLSNIKEFIIKITNYLNKKV
jgi:hypothetical protein